MDTQGNMTADDYLRMADTLGGVSATPEKNSAIEQQMKMVQALRDKGPAGHMAGPNVYVGNSALQSLAPIGEAYAGKRLSDQLMQNAQQQQNARNTMMQMYLRGKGMGGTGAEDMSGVGGAQDPTINLDPMSSQGQGQVYA